jgi:hypothetical protein
MATAQPAATLLIWTVMAVVTPAAMSPEREQAAKTATAQPAATSLTWTVTAFATPAARPRLMEQAATTAMAPVAATSLTWMGMAFATTAHRSPRQMGPVINTAVKVGKVDKAARDKDSVAAVAGTISSKQKLHITKSP